MVAPAGPLGAACLLLHRLAPGRRRDRRPDRGVSRGVDRGLLLAVDDAARIAMAAVRAADSRVEEARFVLFSDDILGAFRAAIE